MSIQQPRLSAPIRVTAVDEGTGDKETRSVQPGDYMVITVAPCYLASVQHHANGTSVITVRGRTVSVVPPLRATEDT